MTKKPTPKTVWVLFININLETRTAVLASKRVIIYGMALKVHALHQQTRLHFQAAHQGEYHDLS